MKSLLTAALLFFSFCAFSQNSHWLLSAGVDYRQYPIDIEDAPLGGLPSSTYGDLTGDKFWKTASIHVRACFRLTHNWQLSIVGYTRYNHNHFTEDPYQADGATTTVYNENTLDKHKIKFDVFADIEKKIRLSKMQEKYLILLGGLGFTNINSGTNFQYLINGPVGTVPQPAIYKGSFLHFGPRCSIGYQYKRIRTTIDAYFIEDPELTNYTSLWLGAAFSYDLLLNRKKKN